MIRSSKRVWPVQHPSLFSSLLFPDLKLFSIFIINPDVNKAPCLQLLSTLIVSGQTPCISTIGLQIRRQHLCCFSGAKSAASRTPIFLSIRVSVDILTRPKVVLPTAPWYDFFTLVFTNKTNIRAYHVEVLLSLLPVTLFLYPVYGPFSFLLRAVL